MWKVPFKFAKVVPYGRIITSHRDTFRTWKTQEDYNKSWATWYWWTGRQG